MALSMTGFGKTNGTFSGKKLSIEIRSLNSKGLDLILKIPTCYRELETDIRKIVGDKISRGKVDMGIYLESSSENPGVNLINKELATTYFNELKKLAESWNQPTGDLLSVVLRMPEVMVQQTEPITEEEKESVLTLIIEACDRLHDFRKQEGAVLAADLLSHIDKIEALSKAVEPFEKERVGIIRDRIERTFNEYASSAVDENRLEQEMIFYIEKLDISEEKVRLKQHLDYFRTTLNEENNGKKLGFIAQEIGREINTMGSKSNHAEMQRCVVDMKDCLEKIKEQLLNIL